MVKTSHSNAGGTGVISGLGTKIPYAAQRDKKKACPTVVLQEPWVPGGCPEESHEACLRGSKPSVGRTQRGLLTGSALL